MKPAADRSSEGDRIGGQWKARWDGMGEGDGELEIAAALAEEVNCPS